MDIGNSGQKLIRQEERPAEKVMAADFAPPHEGYHEECVQAYDLSSCSSASASRQEEGFCGGHGVLPGDSSCEYVTQLDSPFFRLQSVYCQGLTKSGRDLMMRLLRPEHLDEVQGRSLGR